MRSKITVGARPGRAASKYAQTNRKKKVRKGRDARTRAHTHTHTQTPPQKCWVGTQKDKKSGRCVGGAAACEGGIKRHFTCSATATIQKRGREMYCPVGYKSCSPPRSSLPALQAGGLPSTYRPAINARAAVLVKRRALTATTAPGAAHRAGSQTAYLIMN